MAEIYWLQTIGNISIFLNGLFVVMLIVYMTLGVSFLACLNEQQKEGMDFVKKWALRLILPLCISIVGFIFVPSRNDIYAIYGLGGTIDYIKSNDKAKQLPDKVVDALNRYIDYTIEAEDKKEDRHSDK